MHFFLKKIQSNRSSAERRNYCDQETFADKATLFVDWFKLNGGYISEKLEVVNTGPVYGNSLQLRGDVARGELLYGVPDELMLTGKN